MTKRLTKTQVKKYNAEGFLSPIRVMEEEEAYALRREIERFEKSQGRSINGTQKTKVFLPLIINSFFIY